MTQDPSGTGSSNPGTKRRQHSNAVPSHSSASSWLPLALIPGPTGVARPPVPPGAAEPGTSVLQLRNGQLLNNARATRPLPREPAQAGRHPPLLLAVTGPRSTGPSKASVHACFRAASSLPSPRFAATAAGCRGPTPCASREAPFPSASRGEATRPLCGRSCPGRT